MDCIKAGILSHISRICLNDEPVASDDRPHATLAWANKATHLTSLSPQPKQSINYEKDAQVQKTQI